MLERIIGAAENLGITIPGGRKIGVKIPMAGEHPEMLEMLDKLTYEIDTKAR